MVSDESASKSRTLMIIFGKVSALAEIEGACVAFVISFSSFTRRNCLVRFLGRYYWELAYNSSEGFSSINGFSFGVVKRLRA
jgi:hypothetical protein